MISFIVGVPSLTPVASTPTTGKPCLIINGMADVNIIPNENVINSENQAIGDQIRLNETNLGYTPSSSNDKITIKLSNDNSQIAIGQILIQADNFQSASLSIKTVNDSSWRLYATLTANKTIFDNLYATELQFQFISTYNNISYVKLGIIGCFPSGK